MASSGVQSAASSEGQLRGPTGGLLRPGGSSRGRRVGEASGRPAGGGEIQNRCKYSCLRGGGASSPRLSQLHSTPLWGGGQRLSDRPWTKVISPLFCSPGI